MYGDIRFIKCKFSNTVREKFMFSYMEIYNFGVGVQNIMNLRIQL